MQLSDKAKVSFEFNSPAFDRDTLRSSFVYPQTIPDTPNNRLLLGIAGNYQNKKGFDFRKPVEVLSNAKKVMSGAMVAKSKEYNVNNRVGKITGGITDDNGKFRLLLDGKLLSDLKLNGVTTVTGSSLPTPISDYTLLATSIHSQNTTDWANDIITNGHEYFCFPSYFMSKSVYQDIRYMAFNNSLHHQIANRCDSSGLIVPFFDDDNFKPRTLNPVIAPSVYYHKILRHCFEDFGLYIIDESGLFENEDILKSIILCNYNVLKYNVDYYYQVFPSFVTMFGVYTELDTSFSAKEILPDFPIIDFINDAMLKFGTWFEVKGSKVYIRRFKKDKRNSISSFKIDPTIKEEIIDDSGFTISYVPPDSSGLFGGFEDKDYSKNFAEIDMIADSDSVEKGKVFIAHDKGSVYEKKSDGTDSFLFQNMFKASFGTSEKVSFEMKVVPLLMTDAPYIYTEDELDIDSLTTTSGNRSFLPVAEGNSNHHFDARVIEFFEENLGEGDFYQAGVIVDPTQTQTYQKTFPSIGFFFGVRDVYTKRYGFASPYQFLPESTVKLSSFQFGLFGEDNLLDTFLEFIKKIFLSRLRVIMKVYVNEKALEQHNWAYQEHLRGTDYYISKITGEFPINNAITYECYKIE